MVALLVATNALANEKTVWVPMGGTASASVTTVEGQAVWRLPCNFAGTAIERASWDQAVKLDLSACRGVQFKIFCRNTDPIAHCSLYLQSGNGWYHATFFPETPCMALVGSLARSSCRSDLVRGRPAGKS